MWGGYLLAGVGVMMRFFGAGWMAVQLAVEQGDPQLASLFVGIVGLSRALFGLTASVFAGAAADRYDRRVVLWVTQGVAGLLAASLAVLTGLNLLNIWLLLLVSGLSTVCYTFDNPTRTALIPRLVPEKHILGAIGLMQATFQISSLLGPLLAGFLIIVVGPAGLFTASALFYIPVLAALLVLGPQPPREAGHAHPDLLASLRDGLRFVFRDPVLAGIFVLTVVASAMIQPYSQIMPAIAHDILNVGPQELSWLLGASGLASLVGALLLSRLARVQQRGLLVCGLLAVAGVALTLFGQQRDLLPAVALVALIAISTSLFQGLVIFIYQSRAPAEMRGRVLGVQNFSDMGFGPMGIMLFGSLGSIIPLGLGLSAGGLLVVAVAAGTLWRVRAIRALHA
jgi:MFS family permease